MTDQNRLIFDERPDRILPSPLVNGFLRSLGEELGQDDFQKFLKRAGMLHLVQMIESRRFIEMHASEWARLQRMIRLEDNTQAAGLLCKVGKATWPVIMRETTFHRQVELRQASSLPVEVRRIKTLQLLAAQLRHGDGDVSVFLLGQDIIFVDRSSDTTYGINENQITLDPVCWTTVGLIQGALEQMVGQEHHVEETTCRAKGDSACEFKISN